MTGAVTGIVTLTGAIPAFPGAAKRDSPVPTSKLLVELLQRCSARFSESNSMATCSKPLMSAMTARPRYGRPPAQSTKMWQGARTRVNYYYAGRVGVAKLRLRARFRKMRQRAVKGRSINKQTLFS